VHIVVENQLLKNCIRGERKAQYQLYELCYSFLMSVAARYTNSKDDAEDIVNRSFLKILNNIANYREEVPFGLWIRRITINTAIDEYRKRKNEWMMTESTDFSERQFDGISINTYLEKMDAEQIQGLIDHLPESSRKVFNLFVVDGYSHKEIGELLNISEGTSKWHVNHARTRLKELIAKHFPYIKTIAS